ncbi:MAG: hypothetical protein JNM72_06975 [Deltaproteobacteria bacterium]|nr:hypothetical protein [Deltaproteobacteria bacterium]
MSDQVARQSVIASPRPSPKGRKVKDVPFVELRGRRIQGVISSGSDVERVYCAFFDVSTGNFYCSTNNNRRCGGLGGGACKHITELVGEAIKVHGADGLASALGLDPATTRSARELMGAVHGSETKEPAAEVFARFLNDLRYTEMPCSAEPLPEMSWFISG